MTRVNLSTGFPIFLMISVVLTLGASCSKTPEDVHVSPEMTSWFDFRSDTYWIMRDSANGRIDSIIYNGQTYINPSGDKKHKFHPKNFVFIEFDSAATRYDRTFNIIASPTSNGDESLIYFNTGGQRVVYQPFVSVPFKSSGSANTGSGVPGYRDQTLTVTYLGSRIFGGRSYDSVFQFHYAFPNSSLSEDWVVNRARGFLYIRQDNAAINRTLTIARAQVHHN